MQTMRQDILSMPVQKQERDERKQRCLDGRRESVLCIDVVTEEKGTETV